MRYDAWILPLLRRRDDHDTGGNLARGRVDAS
jgi:hypothetical protein